MGKLDTPAYVPYTGIVPEQPGDMQRKTLPQIPEPNVESPSTVNEFSEEIDPAIASIDEFLQQSPGVLSGSRLSAAISMMEGELTGNLQQMEAGFHDFVSALAKSGFQMDPTTASTYFATASFSSMPTDTTFGGYGTTTYGSQGGTTYGTQGGTTYGGQGATTYGVQGNTTYGGYGVTPQTQSPTSTTQTFTGTTNTLSQGSPSTFSADMDALQKTASNPSSSTASQAVTKLAQDINAMDISPTLKADLLDQLSQAAAASTPSDFSAGLSTLTQLMTQVTGSSTSMSLVQATDNLLGDVEGADATLLPQDMANVEMAAKNAGLSQDKVNKVLASLKGVDEGFNSGSLSTLSAAAASTASLVGQFTGSTISGTPQTTGAGGDGSPSTVSSDIEAFVQATSTSTGANVSSSSGSQALSKLVTDLASMSMDTQLSGDLVDQVELLSGASTPSQYNQMLSQLQGMISQASSGSSPSMSLVDATNELVNGYNNGGFDVPKAMMDMQLAAKGAGLDDKKTASLMSSISGIDVAFNSGSAATLSGAVERTASLVGDITGSTISAKVQTQSGGTPSGWTPGMTQSSASPDTIAGLGKDLDAKPQYTGNKKGENNVSFDGYSITFDHKKNKDNQLTIKDKNGNDITPDNLKKNATAGYVTLPDGAALYIGDGGQKAHAYILAGGKTYDITQNKDKGQDLDTGLSVQDFLNANPTNGTVVGYKGDPNDTAGKAFDYLKTFTPELKTPESIDPTTSQSLPSNLPLVGDLDGMGKSDQTPSTVSIDGDRSEVKVGDYDINIWHKKNENVKLTIKDKDGHDITPSGMSKDAKPGYVTLPDGTALYIGSGGHDTHAYVLSGGKSYDMMQDKKKGDTLDAGQDAQDFLNNNAPNGNVKGYTGDGTDAAGKTFDYIKNYTPRSASESTDSTSSTAGAFGTSLGINTLMGNISQDLHGLSADHEDKDMGKDMQSLVKAAAGDDVGAFQKAYDAFLKSTNGSRNKSKNKGADQDRDTLDSMLPVLSTISDEYMTQHKRMTATNGSPDPAKDPAGWTTWANNQTLPTTGFNGLKALNDAKIPPAGSTDSYTAPGKGVQALQPGDSSDSTLSKFADNDDVKKYLADADKASINSGSDAINDLKSKGWQIFNVPGANATVLYNPTSGKLQTFDADSGKKQNMPGILKKDHSSGTMIFDDGTRLDVKNGDGLTFLAGNQLLTTQDPSTNSVTLSADSTSTGDGDFKTWTTDNPQAATLYAEMNSIAPNNTAVQLSHKDMGEKDDGATGWAWMNGISKDGTQAWTATGSGDQGGTGMKGLAWLNDPHSSTNKTITQALYSLNDDGTKTFAPSDASFGWTQKQIGSANISWQNKAKNFLEKFGLDIGLGIAALASIFVGPEATAAVVGALTANIARAGVEIGLAVGRAGTALADAANVGRTGAAIAQGVRATAQTVARTGETLGSRVGTVISDSTRATLQAANKFAGAGAKWVTEGLGVSEETANGVTTAVENGFTKIQGNWRSIQSALNTTAGKTGQAAFVISGTGAMCSGTKAGAIIGGIMTGFVGLDQLPSQIKSFYKGVADGKVAANSTPPAGTPALNEPEGALQALASTVEDESKTLTDSQQVSQDALNQANAIVEAAKAGDMTDAEAQRMLATAAQTFKQGGMPNSAAMAEELEKGFEAKAGGKTPDDHTTPSTHDTTPSGETNPNDNNPPTPVTYAPITRKPVPTVGPSFTVEQAEAATKAITTDFSAAARGHVSENEVVSDLRLLYGDIDSVDDLDEALDPVEKNIKSYGAAAGDTEKAVEATRNELTNNKAALNKAFKDAGMPNRKPLPPRTFPTDVPNRKPLPPRTFPTDVPNRKPLPVASAEQTEVAAQKVTQDLATGNKGTLTQQEMADDVRSIVGDVDSVPELLETALPELQQEIRSRAFGSATADVEKVEVAILQEVKSNPNELAQALAHAPEEKPVAPQQRTAAQNQELFGNSDGVANWNAIQQGNTGDCWFMSTLISNARTDSKSISDKLTLNADGTVTVGGLHNPNTGEAIDPITVNPTADNDLDARVVDEQGNSTKFAAAYELAIEQVMQKYPMTMKSGTELSTAMNGGLPTFAQTILTGQKSVGRNLDNYSEDEVWKMLDEGNHKPVEVDDLGHGSSVYGTRTVNGEKQVGIVDPNFAGKVDWMNYDKFIGEYKTIYTPKGDSVPNSIGVPEPLPAPSPESVSGPLSGDDEYPFGYYDPNEELDEVPSQYGERSPNDSGYGEGDEHSNTPGGFDLSEPWDPGTLSAVYSDMLKRYQTPPEAKVGVTPADAQNIATQTSRDNNRLYQGTFLNTVTPSGNLDRYTAQAAHDSLQTALGADVMSRITSGSDLKMIATELGNNPQTQNPLRGAMQRLGQMSTQELNQMVDPSAATGRLTTDMPKPTANYTVGGEYRQLQNMASKAMAQGGKVTFTDMNGKQWAATMMGKQNDGPKAQLVDPTTGATRTLDLSDYKYFNSVQISTPGQSGRYFIGDQGNVSTTWMGSSPLA